MKTPRIGSDGFYKQYLKVDRARRLCRICAASIESPEHALLICAENEALLQYRVDFLTKVVDRKPDFQIPSDEQEARAALRELLDSPESIAELAVFARRVFSIFTAIELVWPLDFVVDVPHRNAST